MLNTSYKRAGNVKRQHREDASWRLGSRRKTPTLGMHFDIFISSASSGRTCYESERPIAFAGGVAG